MGIAFGEVAGDVFPPHDRDEQERVLCYQSAIEIIEGERIFKLTPESPEYLAEPGTVHSGKALEDNTYAIFVNRPVP